MNNRRRGPARRLDRDLHARGLAHWAVPVGVDDRRRYARDELRAGRPPGDPSTIRQRSLAILPGRLLVFRTIKAPDGFPHFEDLPAASTHFFELKPAGRSGDPRPA